MPAMVSDGALINSKRGRAIHDIIALFGEYLGLRFHHGYVGMIAPKLMNSDVEKIA